MESQNASRSIFGVILARIPLAVSAPRRARFRRAIRSANERCARDLGRITTVLRFAATRRWKILYRVSARLENFRPRPRARHRSAATVIR